MSWDTGTESGGGGGKWGSWGGGSAAPAPAPAFNTSAPQAQSNGNSFGGGGGHEVNGAKGFAGGNNFGTANGFGGADGFAAANNSSAGLFTEDVDAGTRRMNDGRCFNCGGEGHSKMDCPEPQKPRACFNCGAEDHSKADCPEPPKSRACFRCGEEGHSKNECTNEAVEREFTGQCRVCGETGHRASDCPTRPPLVCKNCLAEDHAAVDCKNPRKIDRSDIDDVAAEVAWAQLKAAVAEHDDIGDVKAAAARYVKAVPDTTYVQLESAFRAQNLGIYLIARERELTATMTLMDLQGNLDRSYDVNWRWTNKPLRPKENDTWPASPEENMTRLAEAGEPADRQIPKCANCDELGHTKRNCPQEVQVNADRPSVKCYNCDGEGHRVRDCPNPRPDRFLCKNCNQPGHSVKECTEPRNAEGVECKKCNEMGHFSRDCPQGGGGGPRACFNCGQEGHSKNDCTNERVMKCNNCDEFGHVGRECPKPRDYSRVKCQNCGEMGHTKVRCKAPVKDEDSGDFNAGGGGGGGDFGTANGGGDTFGGVDSFGNGNGGGYGGGGGSSFDLNGAAPSWESGATTSAPAAQVYSGGGW